MWPSTLPPKRDISLGVHGDDFMSCGVYGDLLWVKSWMKRFFDIKDRGTLGFEKEDKKEIII